MTRPVLRGQIDLENRVWELQRVTLIFPRLLQNQRAEARVHSEWGKNFLTVLRRVQLFYVVWKLFTFIIDIFVALQVVCSSCGCCNSFMIFPQVLAEDQNSLVHRAS